MVGVLLLHSSSQRTREFPNLTFSFHVSSLCRPRQDIVETLVDLSLQSSSSSSSSSSLSSRAAAAAQNDAADTLARIEHESNIWTLLKSLCGRHACFQTEHMTREISSASAKEKLQDVERIMALRALHAHEQQRGAPSADSTSSQVFSRVIEVTDSKNDLSPGQWWKDRDDMLFMMGIVSFGVAFDVIEKQFPFSNVKKGTSDEDDEEVCHRCGL